MHELSVAQNIIEIVEGSAKQQGAAYVTVVEIEVGAISGVIPDNLEFAWEIAVKDTMLDKSTLKIDFIAAQARCLNCATEFVMDDIYGICPVCNSTQYDIIHGKELRVKSIHIEQNP